MKENGKHYKEPLFKVKKKKGWEKIFSKRVIREGLAEKAMVEVTLEQRSE